MKLHGLDSAASESLYSAGDAVFESITAKPLRENIRNKSAYIQKAVRNAWEALANAVEHETVYAEGNVDHYETAEGGQTWWQDEYGLWHESLAEEAIATEEGEGGNTEQEWQDDFGWWHEAEQDEAVERNEEENYYEHEVDDEW